MNRQCCGVLLKKEYAVSAEQMFMMKLCMDWCLEYTMLALFLGRPLTRLCSPYSPASKVDRKDVAFPANSVLPVFRLFS
ncbi:MAG: hypothetical protein ACI4B5_00320 [Bacteroidaceae bacterium]